jgi:formylglycine-generating enzyme required for sulfatase activity
VTDIEIHEALAALLPAQFETFLLHAEVPAKYIGAANVAPALRATEVVQWMRQSDAHRAQVVAGLRRVQHASQAERPEPHPWELDYLRERLVAWEQGRLRALAQRATSQHVDRSKLYVSLQVTAQPWCRVDPQGHLIVGGADERAGLHERTGRGSVEEFPSGEGGRPFAEQALSHADLPHLVIQGEAGSGKTVLLQQVAYVLALAHLDRDPPQHELDLGGLRAGAPLLRIPVWVEARAIATPAHGLEGTLLEAVSTALRSVHAVDLGQVEAGLRAGRYLVLIDALDEVPTVAGRQHVLQCVSGLTALGWKSRTVLTTRPTAHTGAQLPTGMRVLQLAPLDDERIGQIVARWCGALGATADERSALQAAIGGVRERHAADNIVENPLLLSCLLFVYDQDHLLPDSTSELYARMVTILCALRQSLRTTSPFSADDRREALMLIFHGMQTAGGTERAVAEIAEELREWRSDDLPSLHAASGFVDELGNDTALLRFDERCDADGRRTFLARPWHRSFQEYLAACFLATTDSVVQETDRLFDARDGRASAVEDPAWEGALTFLVGVLARRQARTYVERLVARVLGVEGLTMPQREGRVLGLAATGMVEYPNHFQGHPLHKTLPGEIARRFEEHGATWPWRDRVLALEALGRLGDPRLKRERWAEIPAGTLVMGGDPDAYDAAPKHDVTVGGFRLSRWPVTVSEYAEFVRAEDYAHECWWAGAPARREPGDWRQQLRHPNRPVVLVTWYEARAWCRWATKHQAAPGEVIALATEEEWEWAARGGEGRKFPWGNQEPGEGDESRASYAWGGAENTGPWRPTPVGAFPLGHCGPLWDLAGNVWEWTATVWRRPEDAAAWQQADTVWSDDDKFCHHDDTQCREGDTDCQEDDNPRGRQSEAARTGQSAAPRVLRGGSWYNGARSLRCAARDGDGPLGRRPSFGFRVVCRRFRQHVGH